MRPQEAREGRPFRSAEPESAPPLSARKPDELWCDWARRVTDEYIGGLTQKQLQHARNLQPRQIPGFCQVNGTVLQRTAIILGIDFNTHDNKMRNSVQVGITMADVHLVAVVSRLEGLPPAEDQNALRGIINCIRNQLKTGLPNARNNRLSTTNKHQSRRR